MISAQCDELRDTADKLDKTSAVSTSWIHHNLTPMMRDAADTIWELRCKLANMVDMRERARVAEVENAKLRVERDEWHRVAASKQDIIDHMRNANAENSELRELCADMFKAMKHVEDSAGMDVMVAYSPWFSPKLRELGLEVDG